MDYEQTKQLIFNDFVLLESSFNILNEYIVNLQIDTKEKYKRIIMIRELAKKKIKSTILDDSTISALIKETNEIYGIKPKVEAKNNRSFRDMIYDDTTSSDHEIIRCNYLYNNSIIYVDSIRDYPHLTNKVFKSLKINEEPDKSKHIFSIAVDKPKSFLNHFNLLKYFLLLNPEFKTPFQANSNGMEITTLDSLTSIQTEVVVMGMIILNEEGKIQLQDNYSVVSLDISECEWGEGYFTQGCIVLVQGIHKNAILKAKCIVHPLPSLNKYNFSEKYENDFFGAITKAFKLEDEKKIKASNVLDISNSSNFLQLNNKNVIINNKNSGAAINNITATNKPEENFLLNFLNKDLASAKYLLPKSIDNHVHYNLETMSKSNFNPNVVERTFNSSAESLIDEFILVISNPDLTNQNVLKAIEKIIGSYNQSNNSVTPFMIVFIGNFISEYSFNCFKSYATAFDNLANVLLKNSSIVKNSYIVFIPGPDDFSLFSGFPKHPIIETVINPLKKKIPNIISATNPARFSIFGKEFVFFRDNLNKKLARNSIPKKDIIVNKESYVWTITGQANLSPFDLSVTSKIWHLTQSMSLLPLPDYLFLADVVEDFSVTRDNTIVVNPGNFTKDFSFSVVSPLRNLVEPCKINL